MQNLLTVPSYLPKIRLFMVSAFLCTFIFYYFMTEIDPANKDWFLGRFIIAIISVIGFLNTFSKKAKSWIRFNLTSVLFAYILQYAYLMYLNDWSVFHRWSYFVLISIIATMVLSWRDYVYLTLFALIVPLAFLSSSPLSMLELFHFFSTILVTFGIIGFTIYANFKYQEELLSLTKNVVQNSKMAALGEMSSGVAHEINNPLAILVLSSQQLKNNIQQGSDPGKMISSAVKITEATNRIARIVEGLRQFSQLDSNEPFIPLNLNEVAEEAYLLFSEKFKSHGIQFIIEHLPLNVFSYCQKSQIAHVFLNLLNNAFDACKLASGPQEVKIIFSYDSKSVKACFKDSGPGVPAGIEAEIFQPFFTTKEIGKGTGLGLSTSLGIARAHHGDLYLDRSVPGSCFTLKLPRVFI